MEAFLIQEMDQILPGCGRTWTLSRREQIQSANSYESQATSEHSIGGGVYIVRCGIASSGHSLCPRVVAFVNVPEEFKSGHGNRCPPRIHRSMGHILSTTSRCDRGFHTVRGCIGPGDQRFRYHGCRRLRFMDDVVIRAWSSILFRHPWLHEQQPISDQSTGPGCSHGVEGRY